MQDEDGRTATSYFAESGQELTPIMYAIKKEQTSVVIKLLNTTLVDCNKRTTKGRSALWFAVEQNSIKVMTELLGNGDGINQEDDYRVHHCFWLPKKAMKKQ